jgi:FkbM family methyltransferase
MIYPPLLRKIGLKREVVADTFWKERFYGLLPEVVSSHIWRWGFFEEEVCYFLCTLLKDGMTFVDVGAHFGFFSLLASYLVGEQGRVIALEPAPQTHQQLLKNVAGHSNISVFQRAAFSESRVLPFNDYGIEHSGYNSAFGIRSTDEQGPRANIIDVQAQRLDDLLDECAVNPIDVVKIDAESSEAYVLDGLRNTLTRFKPAIILETGDYERSGAPPTSMLVDTLSKAGYVAHEFTRGAITRHVIRDSYEYGNLLFVAKEDNASE